MSDEKNVPVEEVDAEELEDEETGLGDEQADHSADEDDAEADDEFFDDGEDDEDWEDEDDDEGDEFFDDDDDDDWEDDDEEDWDEDDEWEDEDEWEEADEENDNPLSYKKVQKTTDDLNSIARDGVAVARELKGAYDDIKGLFDIRGLFKF